MIKLPSIAKQWERDLYKILSVFFKCVLVLCWICLTGHDILDSWTLAQHCATTDTSMNDLTRFLTTCHPFCKTILGLVSIFHQFFVFTTFNGMSQLFSRLCNDWSRCCHGLSWLIWSCHELSLVIMDSLGIKGCHRLLQVVTGYHGPSLVPTSHDG